MAFPTSPPHETIGPSYFQIPADKVNTCVNSGATSSAMISCLGLATQVVRASMGHVNQDVGWTIAAAPFLASRVIQHFVPETDAFAINIGAVAGAGTTLLLGPTPIGFMAGSLLGGVSAAVIAASRVRIIRP